MYYGYARVSTDGQSDESIEVQLTFLERQAKKLEMAFTPIYEKASGKSIEGREEMQRLLSLVKDGDVVGVLDNSRLGRNTQDSLAIAKELRSKGVRLHINGKFINYNDPQDMMLLSIESSISTYFRELQLVKITEGIKQQRSKGNAIFNPKTLGYDHKIINGVRSIEINEEEAKIVRFIFENYAIGKNLSAIEREVRAVIEASGKKLKCSIPTIVAILRRPLYYGYYEYEGQMIKSNYYEPIVSEDLWRTCNALIGERKARKAVRVRYGILSGIFRCERCDAGNYTTNRRGKRSYLVEHRGGCKGIKRDIPADMLDDIAKVCYYITFSSNDDIKDFFYEERTAILTLKASIREELDSINQRQKKLEDSMQKVLSDFIELGLEKKYIAPQIDALKAQIKACEERRDNLVKEYAQQESNEEELYIASVEEMLNNFNKLNVKRVFDEAKFTVDGYIFMKAKNGRTFKVGPIANRRFFNMKNVEIELETKMGENTDLFSLSVSSEGDDFSIVAKWKELESDDDFVQYSNDVGKKLAESINEYVKEV